MSELYTLPEGWEWSNFKDSLYLTDFVANGSFASLKENVNYLDKKDYAILVRLKDFSSKWNGDYIYVDKHSYDFLSKSSLNENDIMMCNVGSVGLHFRVPNLGQPMTIGPNSILIRPSVNYLDNSFLYYYFSSNIFKDFLESIIAKTAQPKFNKTGFKTLSIPLPLLEEQKRIVAKLDNLFAKIDKAIALHQKNIDEANVFMASVLNDVFVELEEKYPLKKVSDGLKNILTGTTPPTKEEKYYNEPSINWYSPSDFGKSKVLSISKNMINSIALTDKKAKIYEKNTLLLVAIGATVGKIGVIKEEASSNQQITAMKFKDDIDVDFSYYWFYYIKQIIINTASAATLPIINQSAIKDLKFIIPPLKTQQKVVLYLDDISQKMEKIKQIQKEKMQSLKELKASILDQAFKGEL